MMIREYNVDEMVEYVKSKKMYTNFDRSAFENAYDKVLEHPRATAIAGYVMDTLDAAYTCHNEYYNATPNLCITHIDSDGLGVGVVAYLDSRARGKDIIIIPSEANATAHTFFALLFMMTAFDSVPSTVYIGDVSVDYAVIDAFRRTNPDAVVSPYIYVDHHITNPAVAANLTVYSKDARITTDGQEYDLHDLFEGFACISAIDTSRELDQLESAVRDLLKIEGTDKVAVSATVLMYVLLRQRIGTDYHLSEVTLKALDDVMVSISQWDTFEWRDHPQYNRGFEFVFPHTLGFKNIADAIFVMTNHIERVIRGYSKKMDSVVPTEFLMDEMYGERITKSTVELMKRKYAVIETDAIVDDDANVIGETMPWYLCIVEFPKVGNQSMIFHEFMTSEVFERLEEDYGSIALVTVSLDCNRLSFRSKGDIDVTTVVKALGGGGHKNAAGCDNEKAAAILREAFIEQNTKSRS